MSGSLEDRISTYKEQQIRLLAENERLRVHLKTVRRALGLSEDIGDGTDIIPSISKLRQSAGLGDDHPLASTFGCMKDEPIWDDLMRVVKEETEPLCSSRAALAQAVIETACKAACAYCEAGEPVIDRAPDFFHRQGACQASRIRSLDVSAIAGGQGDK
jgi:hypothetical protein